MSGERAEHDDDGSVPDVFTFKMKRETISVHTECEKKLADAQSARDAEHTRAVLALAGMEEMTRQKEQAEQRAAALEDIVRKYLQREPKNFAWIDKLAHAALTRPAPRGDVNPHKTCPACNGTGQPTHHTCGWSPA